MVVGIIGGGASGMAAALAAAENPDIQVILLERQARVGRKLQATGNGRCNLTNRNLTQAHYHGEEPEFARPALSERSVEKTLEWFAGLGLFTATEDTGRVYPYSDQANSVVDVLRFALSKPNIRVFTGFEAQKVSYQQEMFVVDGDNQTIKCDKLIVACGGIAGTKLGGTKSGYHILSQLGHRVTKLRPSLVQIKTNWSGITALKGVRANCSVQILCNDRLFSQSKGELQFTEYGLSGPVIFEVSRDVCRGAGEWICRLDFLPNISKEQLLSELCCRRQRNLPVDELLTGIIHNRLGRVLTKAAGILPNQPISALNDYQLQQVCEAVKGFEISLTEPMGMDSAQVTAGGVVTREFDPYTMQSKLVQGLFACGEVLDIDGDCGGYNLQWAWSSGYVAGSHAGKDAK